MRADRPRPIWRDCVLLILLAAAPALLSVWLHPRRPQWTWTRPAAGEIELAEVRRWPEPALWVDARDAAAFRREHVPGAVSLNEQDWEELLPGFLGAWQPGRRIVVYCDSSACDASAAVAARLRRELEIGDVYVLKGGWSAWKETRP